MGATSQTADRGAVELTLQPRPDCVGQSRRVVRELLQHGDRPDLVEPTLLLVSELVTNALLHAGTEIELRAALDGTGVRVEVGDGSPHLPSRRRYAATSGTGRGLLMLESLVDDWGITRHRRGKTVWFELSGDEHVATPVGLPGRVRDPSSGGEPATTYPTQERGRATVSVQLQNMPLLLHAAWQEHAEALLREYLLASMDDPAGDSIQVHAEATDAIAVLEEHVPRTDVRLVPDVLVADAVEPRVSLPLLHVPVPQGSVAHFDTLDRTIEAALDLSREGLVLTPPTQPEVQTFRHWLCRQVLRQAAGNGPEPWSVPPEDADGSRWAAPVEPVRLDEAHDLADVASLVAQGRAVVAADSSSHIVAASPQAAALLGYDDVADLVGHRVVSIIPERYRQAHVAGFTMYLLVDRRPLLGHPVTVPALRRDGTEVTVELLVHEHHGEGPVRVFAELREPSG